MSDNAEESRSTGDLSALIGGLLQNPEALSKMGEVLSRFTQSANSDSPPPNAENASNKDNNKPINDNNSASNGELSPTLNEFKVNDILSNLPSVFSKLSSTKDENFIANKQQIALLLAIRPYLSEHRKELIDTFVKMNHLGAIFKNLT